ncbi:hypothetical protein BCR34DRAFT_603959 [Clohesyomyces aquaticus]|uniref:Uncharacterized protein n=1 Tax=Clohesyomyces aquaticus TaxID=1231657 RepID=A0A1Y1ZAK6_9PLEO|nr:hypothetical protein BCR34DRAFT_603959 [Clohesyomyces aquaticus]
MNPSQGKLVSLPTELLDMIINEVQDLKKDLQNFSPQRRRPKNLVRPFLYNHHDLRIEDPYLFPRTLVEEPPISEEGKPSSKKLLPALDLIKHTTWVQGKSRKKTFRYSGPGLNPALLLDPFSKYPPGRNYAPGVVYARQRVDPPDEAFFIAIIMLTPNLESLEIIKPTPSVTRSGELRWHELPPFSVPTVSRN